MCASVPMLLLILFNLIVSTCVYTAFSKVLNLYVIQMLMCTSPPCSLQSLSLDLSKMTSSLAQNNTLLKLALSCDTLTQEEDVNLFTHHLLLGLSTNTTLTDLTISLPKQCWDWLQEGEVCGSSEGNYCSIVSMS